MRATLFEIFTFFGAKKVAHCLIAQVKVNDDSWIPDYAANVHDIVHKHGESTFLVVAISQRSKETSRLRILWR
jgi:uncharacterized protein (DUF1330 family)